MKTNKGILILIIIVTVICASAAVGLSYWAYLKSREEKSRAAETESSTAKDSGDSAESGNGRNDGTGTDPSAYEEPATEDDSVMTITISAVGDCTLGRNQTMSYSGSFDEYYDEMGGDYFFSDVKTYFEEDDFTVGNCEGVLSDADTMRTTKEWNHKGRPEYAAVFANASFEGLTLGNNHIMDYEEQGVTDTEENITAYGMEYSISSAWGNHLGLYETDKGILIGFVSVNEYYEGQACYTYLEDGLATLREEGADLVLACVHWGGDKTHEIEQDQIDMGHWCIDAGYDLVLGCHPHVLQGIECYNGKYIVYSMGNFCYGGNDNPADKETMIVQATFTYTDGVLSAEPAAIQLIPCRLSSATNYNDYHPVVLTGEELSDWTDHMNGYCEPFGLEFGTDGCLN